MRICILDGETILDKDMLHDTLARLWIFPTGTAGTWTLCMTA